MLNELRQTVRYRRARRPRKSELSGENDLRTMPTLEATAPIRQTQVLDIPRRGRPIRAQNLNAPQHISYATSVSPGVVHDHAAH